MSPDQPGYFNTRQHQSSHRVDGHSLSSCLTNWIVFQHSQPSCLTLKIWQRSIKYNFLYTLLTAVDTSPPVNQFLPIKWCWNFHLWNEREFPHTEVIMGLLLLSQQVDIFTREKQFVVWYVIWHKSMSKILNIYRFCVPRMVCVYRSPCCPRSQMSAGV